MSDGLVTGKLYNKGEYGEFTFTYNNVIKMMAIAQSRYARRANIKDVNVPNYLSPLISKNKKIPLVNNYLVDANKCTICLDTIENNNLKLKCNHSFHKKCILLWKEHKDSCPVCRAPIVYNINHVKNIKLNNYIIPNRYSSDSLLSNDDSINTIIRNRREIRRNSVSSTVSSIRSRYNLRPRTNTTS